MTKPQRKVHRLVWFVLAPMVIVCAVWALIFARPSRAVRGVNPADRVQDLVVKGGARP